jgi:hypothetical protein
MTTVDHDRLDHHSKPFTKAQNKVRRVNQFSVPAVQSATLIPTDSIAAWPDFLNGLGNG